MKKAEDSIEIKEDKDRAVSNSVAFPRADAFERKAKAEPIMVYSDAYCDVVAYPSSDIDWDSEECKEAERRAKERLGTFIDWDSWFEEVKRRAEGASPQCQKALEEGRFDHCLMKWFRQGRHPIYVQYMGFLGWDWWHGYRKPREDFS